MCDPGLPFLQKKVKKKKVKEVEKMKELKKCYKFDNYTSLVYSNLL